MSKKAGTEGRAQLRGRRAGVVLASLWLLVVAGTLAALGAAWLGGLRLEAVDTNSMTPAIPRGSLAAVAPMHTWEIEPGDVIAFRLPSNRRVEVLHRVVKNVRQPSGLFFQTKGDANPSPDPIFVPQDDVVGRLRWHLPHIGVAGRVLRPPVGYVVLVGVPLVFLVLGEISGRRRRPASRAMRPRAFAEPFDAFRDQLISC